MSSHLPCVILFSLTDPFVTFLPTSSPSVPGPLPLRRPCLWSIVCSWLGVRASPTTHPLAHLVPVSCMITAPKRGGGNKDFFVLFYFLPFCNRIKIVDKLLNGWGFFTIFNISDFF